MTEKSNSHSGIRFLVIAAALVIIIGGINIAAVPAVLLTLIQLGAGTAALAAAEYLVVDLTLGNLFVCLLHKRRLGRKTC